MRFLLDTHALLWFCEGNAMLSRVARAAMEDGSNQRYISHATVWEVAIKLNLGKLKLEVDYGLLFTGVLEANGFEILPTKMAHYSALISLPRHHGDPFDRLLVAQAQVDDLVLVSSDKHFAAYGVPLLW